MGKRSALRRNDGIAQLGQLPWICVGVWRSDAECVWPWWSVEHSRQDYRPDRHSMPENWGECDGCQWWPFAPVKYADKLGLKACVFDNTGDGDFYKTSEFLAKEWPSLGNPAESHFASGGHCQNIPYETIVK